MKTAANVSIEDVLTDDRPDDLGTGFDASWVCEPRFIIGETGTVEIHPAQPYKYDGEMSEVSTENLTRNVFQVTSVTIEIMCVSMKIPNPRRGFWSLS